MAAADCYLCAADGNRSCDICGGIVFPHNLAARTHESRELCGYCLQDLALAARRD